MTENVGFPLGFAAVRCEGVRYCIGVGLLKWGVLRIKKELLCIEGRRACMPAWIARRRRISSAIAVRNARRRRIVSCTRPCSDHW